MDLGVMIEGQEDVSWDLWRRIYTAVEDLGFESLWRSDHLFSLSGPRTGEALETFISFVLVAEHTARLRFGPLVSPVTFRHPSLLARMAAQIDALSSGRFILGVGAGWNVPEHQAFGLPFPKVRERMDRLEEAIQVMKALWGFAPATFDGRYYQLRGAESYPKPVQSPLPVLVGGVGERLTLRIVAKHADEWNSLGVDLDSYLRKREVLERHCHQVGRDPGAIKHSQMSGFIVGLNRKEVREHLRRIAERLPVDAIVGPMGADPDSVLRSAKERGWLVGTPNEVVDELGRREEAGISRLMLQHHANQDFEVLELLAKHVLPQVQRESILPSTIEDSGA
jgi:F420-dependent oxidoreductase-like protein